MDCIDASVCGTERNKQGIVSQITWDDMTYFKDAKMGSLVQGLTWKAILVCFCLSVVKSAAIGKHFKSHSTAMKCFLPLQIINNEAITLASGVQTTVWSNLKTLQDNCKSGQIPPWISFF